MLHLLYIYLVCLKKPTPFKKQYHGSSLNWLSAMGSLPCVSKILSKISLLHKAIVPHFSDVLQYFYA